MKFTYAPGATALSPDEIDGLIPEHITTQAELNAWEQQNILEGRDRLARRRPGKLLDDATVKLVHERMFDKTWRWAGQYRLSGKNIGVDWAQIPERVCVLCADVQAQVDHAAYPADELAARFHHRLVAIHPFANGNGRHARQMADLLLQSLGGAPFTWGAADLGDIGEGRDRYLAALRAADAHDYGPLLQFVRS